MLKMKCQMDFAFPFEIWQMLQIMCAQTEYAIAIACYPEYDTVVPVRQNGKLKSGFTSHIHTLTDVHYICTAAVPPHLTHKSV